jgi:hypothetical protein
MPNIKRIEIRDERELESILCDDISSLEDGLNIIQRQFPTESGPIDILAIDSDMNMVIIELKINESDVMLMQALRYYDYCIQNSDRIKSLYSDKIKELSGDVRIILVAPEFSQTLRKAVKYIEPQLDLKEYDYLEINGLKGLYCKAIEIEPVKEIPRRRSTEDHLNYIQSDRIREVCKNAIERIKSFDKENIEVRAVKYYIGFQYRGRLFARIKTKQNYFYLMGVAQGEWELEKTKISKDSDVKDEFIKKLCELFENLKP